MIAVKNFENQILTFFSISLSKFCLSYVGQISSLIVDVTFKRLDTGGNAVSHYNLKTVTFPAGKSDLFCFNLKDEIFAQSYLTGHLKMEKFKAVWVSRLRVVTESVNTDFYIDNVYMGKNELKG